MKVYEPAALEGIDTMKTKSFRAAMCPACNSRPGRRTTAPLWVCVQAARLTTSEVKRKSIMRPMPSTPRATGVGCVPRRRRLTLPSGTPIGERASCVGAVQFSGACAGCGRRRTSSCSPNCSATPMVANATGSALRRNLPTTPT